MLIQTVAPLVAFPLASFSIQQVVSVGLLMTKPLDKLPANITGEHMSSSPPMDVDLEPSPILMEQILVVAI